MDASEKCERISSKTEGSIFIVSNGTPGIEYNTAECPNLSSGKRNTIMGAVPNLLGITSAFSGTLA